MKRLLLFACALAALCAAAATSAQTARPQTRVETDQATGTIRFIVNGAEQARIDGSGLHVRDNVEYGGTITDAGAAYSGRQAKSGHAE